VRASTSCVPTGNQHFFRRELPALSKLWRELHILCSYILWRELFLRGTSISSGESYRLSVSSGESSTSCVPTGTSISSGESYRLSVSSGESSTPCVPTGTSRFGREHPALSKLWRELHILRSYRNQHFLPTRELPALSKLW
jgi:hypothetical protein